MCHHRLNLPPFDAETYDDPKVGDRAQCEHCGEWFERFVQDDGNRGYWAWRSVIPVHDYA